MKKICIFAVLGAALIAAHGGEDLQQLLERMYARDIAMGNHGRVKWHGPRTTQIIDRDSEGRLVRIDIYTDGFAYTNVPPVKTTVIKPKERIIYKQLPVKIQSNVSNRVENAKQN